MPASERDPATPTTPALVLAQRMHALGFLADGVAHDLANPLGAIQAFAALIAGDERIPDDLRIDAELLRAEADRTYRLVSTLLDVARTRPPVVRPTPVGDTIAGILELAAHPLAGVTVELAIEDDLPDVLVDPSAFRQALAAILVDSLERLGTPDTRGRLRIGATAVRGDVTAVRLSVADDGRAHDPGTGGRELLDRLGVPVRRGSDGAPGHLRNLTALELPAAGWPPRSGDGPAEAAARPALASAGGGAHRPVVLVCDDEASVRALLVRVLERAGCVAIEAASGEEALAMIETTGVDALLCDQRLPGITGIELYERASAIRPDLRRRFVLLSGDPESSEIVAFVARSHAPIVAKPFDLARIELTIRSVVLPVTTA